ncbi:MAG: hypothetical protein JWN35_3167 [Frankiales bacterium]|nr:hypothetical protein [Frankiales bacterium]
MTTPGTLLSQVLAQLQASPEPRMREVMTSLVRHLHEFAAEVRLTDREWAAAVGFLTETGRLPERDEFILLSDTLGLSMLVDLLGGHAAEGATETTVLGPFYVPDSPRRGNGTSTAERPSGDPAFVSGRVLGTDGTSITGAEVDVWQNGADMMYAVQDKTMPPGNLRGLFTTDDEGRFSFLGVRPVDYPVPVDGPVGRLLEATGRHPWRAAHLHAIVRADGYHPVTTHLFDDESRYLDSDVVFGVKPSLIKHFTPHEPGQPDRPAGIGPAERWYSLDHDFVLVRAT